MERFAPSHLFDDQQGLPDSPLYWVLGALFLLLLAVALYTYLRAEARFPDSRLHRRLARRYAALAASFSGLGLAASVFTLLAVPFLSKRFWLVVAVLGLLVTGGYWLFYLRKRYPTARRAEAERLRRERYLPRPRGSGRRRRRRRG